MKLIFKSTCAAAAIAGAAILLPSVAAAGVDVSVGIGVPSLVYAPGPGYAPYEGQIYYDPIYFGGAWYHGPYRWRMMHGQRVFWVDGGWHHNEWRGGAIPGSLTFRNGGYYRDGRYDGFHGAERINVRFPVSSNAMRGDHPELIHADHPGMMRDRPDMRPDRSDMRPDRPGRSNVRPADASPDRPAPRN